MLQRPANCSTKEQDMKRFVAVLCGLLLLALLGCRSDQGAPIRLGLSQWPAYEFFRLAEHPNLTMLPAMLPASVRLVDFYSPVDLLQAYHLGQVDAITCTIVEYLHLLEMGRRDPVIVGVIDASQGADVLLAPDSLTSLSQLKGMRIGLEAGTVGEIILAGALQEAGLRPEDVRRVPFHLQLDRGPLPENDLDAVVCFPPFSSSLLRRGTLNILYDSSRLPSPLFDVLVVERRLAEERAADLGALLRTHYAVQLERQEDGAWADSLMAGWEGVPVEEFRATFAGLRLFTTQEQLPLLERQVPASLLAAHTLLARQGLLKKASPDPARCIHAGAAREAAHAH